MIAPSLRRRCLCYFLAAFAARLADISCAAAASFSRRFFLSPSVLPIFHADSAAAFFAWSAAVLFFDTLRRALSFSFFLSRCYAAASIFFRRLMPPPPTRYIDFRCFRHTAFAPQPAPACHFSADAVSSPPCFFHIRLFSHCWITRHDKRRAAPAAFASDILPFLSSRSAATLSPALFALPRRASIDISSPKI